MANELSLEGDEIRAGATTINTLAGDIAGAANGNTLASITSMTPVFGIIGADFLASFAVAELLHDKDINALAAKFTKLSEAANTTVTAVETQDTSLATQIGAKG
ncbi:type VII secretion target [Nocardia huaxiensis]|uniref:ESX-1 secretion-associated protein n=1 Tax=Nocardia huaxiensis TaxID=2755382 RepID=A0A7D6V704_9NOCA|nr:type VII secretion target [Nocardia huaxiensis]QLY29101.1 ESX-1 secretion-associated protein [Nocardia huaxiensis]UFS97410.1 ESX-1 secretion-associated protein [Nocardia huaxiensis]